MNYLTKIMRMLEKDLKLFYRDKRTFFLVFLAPVIIMFVLSNIFNVSDTNQSIKGITIAVCNLDDESLELDTDVFNIYELDVSGSKDCSEEARTLVRNGDFRAAVIIPKGFSNNILEGSGTELFSVIDNAKSQISIVASAAMKGFVSDLNEEIGTAFIEAAWKKLNELNQKLKAADSELEVAKNHALEIQKRSRQVKTELDALDLMHVRSELVNFNQSLIDYQSDIDDILIDLDKISALEKVNVSEINVSALKADLELTELNSIYKKYCLMGSLLGIGLPNITDSGISVLCPVLNSTVEKVKEFNENNLLGNNYTLILLNRTNSYIDALNTISEKNNKTKVKLKAIKSELGDYQKNLSDVFGYVDQLIESEEKIRAEIDNIDYLITNYTQKIIDTQKELNKTSVELDKYTEKDPKNIIRAVTLNEENTFPNKKVLEFMTPGIIALILLFITMFISSSMIVSERKSGCMARNFLSKISIFTFVIQKSIYLLILAMIEIICMLIVSLVFGIKIPMSFSLLISLILVSFCFVCLGILIGALSKTENTSLLTSLVIGLPMLFLSGLFFPFEIMPAVMRSIGYYLPLSLSVRILDNIIVYGHGIDWKASLILILISIVIFLLASLIIKLKPTVD